MIQFILFFGWVFQPPTSYITVRPWKMMVRRHTRYTRLSFWGPVIFWVSELLNFQGLFHGQAGWVRNFSPTLSNPKGLCAGSSGDLGWLLYGGAALGRFGKGGRVLSWWSLGTEIFPYESGMQGRYEGWRLTLLMAEILHQLRLVVYPIIFLGFHTSQVVQDFSHQQHDRDPLRYKCDNPAICHSFWEWVTHAHIQLVVLHYPQKNESI